jgi:hypothetical protein
MLVTATLLVDNSAEVRGSLRCAHVSTPRSKEIDAPNFYA